MKTLFTRDNAAMLLIDHQQGTIKLAANIDRDTMEDIDIIVSALQGGPEVIIDGQRALAEGGVAAGARRILPSDFSVDFRALVAIGGYAERPIRQGGIGGRQFE